MTPDERAARAERVVQESIAQLRELAEWYHTSPQPSCVLYGDAFDYAADAVARNARCAGMMIDPPRRGMTGGASSSPS